MHTRALVLLVALLGAAPQVRSADPAPGPDPIAGIEVAAKGYRVTVVSAQETPWRSTRIEVRYEATTAGPLGVALARDGKFSPEAVADSATAVARLVNLVQSEYGVKPGRIHLAAGGSVASAPGFDALAIAIEKKTGRPLTGVPAETETLLAMRGVMPDEYLSRAVYLDIGAGTLKVGTFVPAGPKNLSEFRSFSVGGVLPFEQAARARVKADPRLTFPAATRLESAALAERLERKGAENPALENRTDVMLTGGTPWALVTLMKPDAALSAYVPVTAGDITRFAEALRKERRVPEPDLSALRWDTLKQTAAGEVQRVKDTFTADQLLGGAEILVAAAKSFKLDGKRVYFPRHGHTPWVAIFAVERTTGKPVK